MRLLLVAAAAFSLFVGQALAQDTVLVSWRNLNLTQSDYEAALQALPEADRLAFQMSMSRITGMLSTMLLNRTLAAEARQLGLDKDPVIQGEIALAAERVLANRRIEAFEKSLKVPDMAAAAEERYRVKREDFSDPERVRASHVLVNTKARSDDEARLRAEEVQRKALAGADFAELAKEFSDDPSAKSNQGNLGLFGRGRMAKPFEDAAFALEKPGDISPVVKTPFGYHVIVLHQKQPRRQKPFSEVKEGLMAQLTKTYVENEKKRHVEAIGKDESIVINTAALDNLKKEMPKIPPLPPLTETPAARDAAAPVRGK